MHDTLYELIDAIRQTHGNQRKSWAGAVGDRLMARVHSYADACEAYPRSSVKIEAALSDVQYDISLVTGLLGEE